MDAGQLADALHKLALMLDDFLLGEHRERAVLFHLLQLGQLLVGGGSILNGVVQQRRLDGFAVQMQLLCHDLGHRQRMGHKGGAVLAQLGAVQVAGKFVGLPDQGEVGGGVILPHRILQMLIHGVDIHGFAHCASPPPRPASASVRRCMYWESSRRTFFSPAARCRMMSSP